MAVRILKIVKYVILALILCVILYLGYVMIDYNRIADHQVLEVSGQAKGETLQRQKVYTAVTQNCGFGAYTPEFTFFMDGGRESWGKSRESVISCIDQVGKTAASFEPDFVLFQEVDTDSTRSYHVNQLQQLSEFFPEHAWDFAVNYHSAFLLYPFTQPHGASNSGILTFFGTAIDHAERRKLEISNSFSRFLDLDRCYSVSHIPVEDGKELVLYNVHLSAYGGSDAIRTSQMNMLLQDMRSEYAAGNYCVCGGDFNHDFTGDSTIVLGGEKITDFGWAQPFPRDLLPEGIVQCIAYDDEELIPTCRNCDIPYQKGNPVFVVDGFLVSENVRVHQLNNIDTGFVFSDHNPVVMKFSLQ